jgi:hypothetical protein
VLCIACLHSLARTQEKGFGPFKRAAIEVHCPECESLIHRTEFPSELEQSARDVLAIGRERAERAMKAVGIETSVIEEKLGTAAVVGRKQVQKVMQRLGKEVLLRQLRSREEK